MVPSRSTLSVSSSTSTSEPLAARLAGIEPFRVMEILAAARGLQAQGRDIIHLEVGEPDFPTPEPIVEAGMAALRAGQTHYTPALGLPELRRAIATYYADRYGVALSEGRVAVTPGASGGLLLAMAALFNPEDEVLMADPGYPCNRHFARLLGVRPRSLPVGPECRFQLTAESVAKGWTKRTRGVLVANPGNPAGTAISMEELQGILAVVQQHDGWLIVDEIYHELVYGATLPSAAGLGDRVIVISSFSKYFLMTGWRLGWMVAPDAVMPALDKLAQNLFLSPATISQHAALTALGKETRGLLDACRDELGQRRDLLVPALTQLGFHVPVTPDGAFYVYARLPERVSLDSTAFCRDLLDKAGVAITPGADFGDFQAGRHVRFAYTTDLERIQEAVERIRRYMD